MASPPLIFLLMFVSVIMSHQDVLRRTFNNSSVERKYSGKVADGEEDIYHFTLPHAVLWNSTVRIISSSRHATENVPVVFFVRSVRDAVSWKVPFVTDERIKYTHVAETLCLSVNQEGTMQDFSLEISSASSKKLDYNFTVHIKPEVSLKPSHPEQSTVNPAEPTFFFYEFTGDQERVVVKVESDSKTCTTLKIQTSKCPDSQSSNSDRSGIYATFTTKAAVVIERSRIIGGQFHVLLEVEDADTECQVRRGTINPFIPPRDKHKFYNTKERIPATLIVTREKSVTVSVEVLPNIEDYLIPMMAPIFVFAGFYLIGLIMLVIAWFRSDNSGRSIYPYLFPPKFKDLAIADGGDGGQNNIPEPEIAVTTSSQSHESYGTENPIQPVQKTSENGEVSDDDIDGHDFDRLEDINEHKDVYRFKDKEVTPLQLSQFWIQANLTVAELSRKSYEMLNKKFTIYFWNILTVAVFYALPVAQLVLTYQRVVDTSGDQDICYYNNFCQRPYHLFSAFNNVYSNVGYVMLGILFILLVVRRNMEYQSIMVFFMLWLPLVFFTTLSLFCFFLSGFALFMEGVMSACYHVCPNYSNFQFDTAFMYIIGILGCLRLYQSRHQDLIVNAHFAYAGLALIIFVAVLGVVFRSREFWAFFMLAHFAACCYVSCQIYYRGRIIAGLKNWISERQNFWTRPISPFRLALLLVFNIINWGLSIYGIATVPSDFMTYLLGIIVCNGLIYVGFYVVMKCICGECIKLLPLLCIIASIVTWGISLFFFAQGLTNWKVSPAESREGNKDCRILNFYDDHDLWHFLSATAMFFSFISILTIDDDLNGKERSLIRVF